MWRSPLTYAAQRILTRHSLPREFPRSMISKAPFANSIPPLNDAFKRLQEGAFADWRLSVDGMVARPGSYSLADLRSFPVCSQITEVVCEEGWSYIAEWIGTALFEMLKASAVPPQARCLGISRSTPTGGRASISPMLSILRLSWLGP